jgi:hypothetical protein
MKGTLSALAFVAAFLTIARAESDFGVLTPESIGYVTAACARPAISLLKSNASSIIWGWNPLG